MTSSTFAKNTVYIKHFQSIQNFQISSDFLWIWAFFMILSVWVKWTSKKFLKPREHCSWSITAYLNSFISSQRRLKKLLSLVWSLKKAGVTQEGPSGGRQILRSKAKVTPCPGVHKLEWYAWSFYKIKLCCPLYFLVCK